MPKFALRYPFFIIMMCLVALLIGVVNIASMPVELFFTLGANIDHSESRSLTGVSLIKIYFKRGTDPNAALSNIANLAMADLRRLPQGTLPPVVLKFDASSLPVCLLTVEGEGLNETQLHDYLQYQIR